MNDLLNLVDAVRALDQEGLVFPVHADKSPNAGGSWKTPIPLEALQDRIRRGVKMLGVSPPPGVVALDLDNPTESLMRRLDGVKRIGFYESPSGGRHYWLRVRGADIDRLPRKWTHRGVHVGEVIKPGLHYAAVHVPAILARAFGYVRKAQPVELADLKRVIDIEPVDAKPKTNGALRATTRSHAVAVDEGDISARMDGFRESLIPHMKSAVKPAGNKKGNRNNTLFALGARLAQHAAHYGLGRGYLDPLGAAAEDRGLGAGEVKETLDSAWTKGSTNPEPLEERITFTPVKPRPRQASKPNGLARTPSSPAVNLQLLNDAKKKPDSVNLLEHAPDDARGHIPTGGADFNNLKRVLLELGFQVRFNLRGRDEWKWEHEGPGAWRTITKRKFNRLFVEIAQRYTVRNPRKKGEPMPLSYGSTLMDRYLLAYLDDREVDPFLEYLQELPAWDGIPRLSPDVGDGVNWLSYLFGVDDTRLNRWAARVLFLGAVKRTYEPGSKLDQVPVFVGAQGLGKSAMLASIVPQFDPRFFGDELSLADPSLQRQVEATDGKVIIEAAEMGFVQRSLLGKMKSWITRTKDEVRRAYGRNVTSRLRRFVVAGTANPGNPLPNDPTGNRRFMVVDLPGYRRDGVLGARMAVEDFFERACKSGDALRDQLWAEALYRVRVLGESPRLPRDLAADQAAVNEAYRDRDDVLEDRLAALDWPEPLTLNDICRKLNADGGDDVKDYFVKIALRAMGWTYTGELERSPTLRYEKKRVRLWRPPVESE